MIDRSIAFVSAAFEEGVKSKERWAPIYTLDKFEKTGGESG